jgi:hypothetical protein
MKLIDLTGTSVQSPVHVVMNFDSHKGREFLNQFRDCFVLKDLGEQPEIFPPLPYFI